MSTIKIHQIRYSDGYGFQTVYVIDPASTSVQAVKKAGAKVLETHKRLKEVERAQQAAHADVKAADEINKNAARKAALAGLAVKPKELRKRAAADREKAAELDLEWEGALAKMRSMRLKYLEVIEHHTPALRAEAKQALDSAILSVASASQIALRAEAAMTGALELLGGLASGDFTPRQLVASQREHGEGGAPAVWVSSARESLGKAVGYAAQILEEVKAAEKAARLEAEADDEPDEVDEAKLDPDLFDVGAEEDD